MAGEGVDGLSTLADEVAMEDFVEALRAYASGLTENFASLTNAQPEDQLISGVRLRRNHARLLSTDFAAVATCSTRSTWLRAAAKRSRYASATWDSESQAV